MSKKAPLRWQYTAIAAAVASICASPALAIEINTESGWTGALTTSISVWANQRAESQDRSLTSQAAAPALGRPAGAPGFSSIGLSKGPGAWNYDNGDLYSSGVKFLTELTLAKDNFSFLGRVKGWHDHTLKEQNVPYGNRAAWGKARFPLSGTKGLVNAKAGERWNKPLSDTGADELQKFSNIYLLDFVGTWKTELGGNPASFRAGRHTINWGEGVFMRGIGQLAPLDVSSLRKAGADLKESLLPTWALSGSVGFEDFSVEGFYQLKWEPSTIEYCGTYWNVGHISASPNPGRCNVAENAGVTADRLTDYNQINLPLLRGDKPDDAGAFGVAVRFPIEAIDTELSVYYQKIKATTPSLRWSGIKGPGNVFSLATSSATFNYLDNIDIYGVSATTNLGGVNWAGELSYQKDIPVGYNGDDANALLGVNNPQRNRVVNKLSGLANGTPVSFDWFDRHNKVHFILNGITTLPTSFARALGASNGSVVGEVGFEWNDIEDSKKAGALRYGRTVGLAPFIDSSGALRNDVGAALAGVNCLTGAGIRTKQDKTWCGRDGFVTDFSWGYRLRTSLTYSQILGSSWTFKPSLYFAHDVEGVSMDGQFQEDRKTFALGLGFDLNGSHFVDVGYTTYDGKFNFDRDKDNFSFAYSYKF